MSKLNCRESNEAEDGNDAGWNGSDENPPVLPSSGPEAMTPIWNKIESESLETDTATCSSGASEHLSPIYHDQSYSRT